MKKLLFTFFIAAATLTVSHAQSSDPAAKKLLNEVSKKYDSYKTIRSEFTLSVQDANKNTYTNDGEMFFNKPKKQYAIKLKDQELLSDGKNVWNISYENKEVQITEAEENDDAIGPNNLFTFYQKGYKYITMDNETYRKEGKQETLRVVELSPLDVNTNYFKIKLRVNKNNHIHDVTIFDKSSNKYTYTIKSLYLDQRFTDSHFTYNKSKYPNYEVIDLR